MNLLLDTHVFLWYVTANISLPAAHQQDIAEPNNQVFLSVASIWEAVIKHALGKLPLPQPPADYLPQLRAAHGIISLAINEDTLRQLARLSPLHRDPFDRIIIAQALQGGLTLVTTDPVVKAYPVTCL